MLALVGLGTYDQPGADQRIAAAVDGRSAPSPTVLGSRDDVMRLRRAASPHSLRTSSGPIHVRIPGLSPAERLRAELQLNAAARDCGCATGSSFASLALLACAAYLWIALGSPLRAARGDLITTGVVVVAAAIAGKLVGLVRARRALVHGLDALAADTETVARA